MSPKGLTSIAIAEWNGLTISQAAAEMGTSESTIRRAMKHDLYPGIRDSVYALLLQKHVIETHVEFEIIANTKKLSLEED